MGNHFHLEPQHCNSTMNIIHIFMFCLAGLSAATPLPKPENDETVDYFILEDFDVDVTTFAGDNVITTPTPPPPPRPPTTTLRPTTTGEGGTTVVSGDSWCSLNCGERVCGDEPCWKHPLCEERGCLAAAVSEGETSTVEGEIFTIQTSVPEEETTESVPVLADLVEVKIPTINLPETTTATATTDPIIITTIFEPLITTTPTTTTTTTTTTRTPTEQCPIPERFSSFTGRSASSLVDCSWDFFRCFLSPGCCRERWERCCGQVIRYQSQSVYRTNTGFILYI